MKRYMTMVLAVVGGVALTMGTVGCQGSSNSGGSGDSNRLDGAGSTFVDPLLQEWSNRYEKSAGIKVNYQSKGSGAGIDMMTDKKVNFGCTDAPMTDEQLAKAKSNGGTVIHVPIVMGGVVPAYNLPDVKGTVQFTGKILADIYLGKITKWNDDALKAVNKDLELPKLDISVVYRGDSSGTTNIWTDYLNKVAEDWKPVGVSTKVDFKVGVGQKGTDGVAGFISRTPGAIGYVELIYALKNNIKFGSVENAAGKFIVADMKSVTAAANSSLKQIPEDLRYSITNAPGEDAYPISGTTWAILYVNQPGDKVKALTGFLKWVTHEGQKYCEELHYAPLPEGLVKKVDEKLTLVKAATK